MRRLFLPINTTPQLFFNWLNIVVLNDRRKQFSINSTLKFSFKLPIELQEWRGQYLIQVTGELNQTQVAPPRTTEVPLFNFEVAQKRPSEIQLVYEFYRDDCEDFKSWFDEMIEHLVFDFPEAQSKPDAETKHMETDGENADKYAALSTTSAKSEVIDPTIKKIISEWVNRDVLCSYKNMGQFLTYVDNTYHIYLSEKQFKTVLKKAGEVGFLRKAQNNKWVLSDA